MTENSFLYNVDMSMPLVFRNMAKQYKFFKAKVAF
jgi:hypothetical protein